MNSQANHRTRGASGKRLGAGTVRLPNPATNAFDLFVGGVFNRAGSALLKSYNIGQWSVGRTGATNAPRVSVTLPTMYATFTDPISITNRVNVAAGATNINFVEYYLNGVLIRQSTERGQTELLTQERVASP